MTWCRRAAGRRVGAADAPAVQTIRPRWRRRHGPPRPRQTPNNRLTDATRAAILELFHQSTTTSAPPSPAKSSRTTTTTCAPTRSQRCSSKRACGSRAQARQAPQPPAAARLLRAARADGWQRARLVRGTRRALRADGRHRRCHQPDAGPLPPARDARRGVRSVRTLDDAARPAAGALRRPGRRFTAADREPGGDELLAGKTPVTQFGRAMAELGVELILANSPQAKGRVERRNAVFQDRLVKELRLAGISDMERANALLDGSSSPASTRGSASSRRRRRPMPIGPRSRSIGSTRFSASRSPASSATTGACAGTTAGCRSTAAPGPGPARQATCVSSTNAMARCCWSTKAIRLHPAPVAQPPPQRPSDPNGRSSRTTRCGSRRLASLECGHVTCGRRVIRRPCRLGPPTQPRGEDGASGQGGRKPRRTAQRFLLCGFRQSAAQLLYPPRSGAAQPSPA